LHIVNLYVILINREKNFIFFGGKQMEKEWEKITEEELKNMTAEEIVDLKADAEHLRETLQEILELCDEALNS